jgi:hypothetical protein
VSPLWANWLAACAPSAGKARSRKSRLACAKQGVSMLSREKRRGPRPPLPIIMESIGLSGVWSAPVDQPLIDQYSRPPSVSVDRGGRRKKWKQENLKKRLQRYTRLLTNLGMSSILLNVRQMGTCLDQLDRSQRNVQ